MPTTAPPAPADAPAKTGAVSPEPSPSQDTSAFSDSMVELDSLAADSAPPDPPKPGKGKGKDKAPGKEPEKGPEDELEGLGDDPEPAEPPPATKPENGKPEKPAGLREKLYQTQETLKHRDAELATLRNELKIAKETPREDPEKATLLGKLQEADKHRSALEEKLRLLDFQQSDDFVKNYQKPWEDAWQKAAREIQELTLELDDGNQRPATIQDLIALSNMKMGEARQYAKKMFGESAEDVMAHLRKLRDLSDAQQKALDDAKVNSEAHFKKASEEALQRRQKTAKLWKDENDSWPARYPKFFKPIDGDEEGNTMLARGYELADKAFSGNGKTTPEERVKLHAEVRNKAAAFPRLALQFKRARARIAELEKQLKEFEDTEPPAGAGRRSGGPKESGDIVGDALSELDQLSKE